MEIIQCIKAKIYNINQLHTTLVIHWQFRLLGHLGNERPLNIGPHDRNTSDGPIGSCLPSPHPPLPPPPPPPPHHAPHPGVAAAAAAAAMAHGLGHAFNEQLKVEYYDNQIFLI